jgi:hypothetical protein
MLIFSHQRRSAIRDGAVRGSNRSCARIGATGGEENFCESRSRRFNRICPSRSLCFALLAIVALASEPANADSSASPSRDRRPDTSSNQAGSASQNPAGFVSQNVCGGDLGMLQQAEDVINNILRVDGPEIYHCTKL